MQSFFVDSNSALKTDPLWQSPKGYLRCNAVVTAAKVLRYYDAQGNRFDVLRHPDQVFDSASLKTLAGLPLTVNHPVEDGQNVLVTPENWQRYAVGTLGDSIIADNPFVKIEGLNISAAIALDSINAGLKQLSPGYEAVLVDESGVFEGIPYNRRQYEIVYDHAAILEEGRNGEAVKLLLNDSANVFIDSGYDFQDEKPIIIPIQGFKKMSTKSLIVDVKGLPKASYLITDAGEVTLSAEDFQNLIDLNNAQFEALSALQANAIPADELAAVAKDSPAALLDGYKELLAENNILKTSSLTTDEIQKAAKLRSELIAKATPFVTVDHAQSDRQIKEAVLTHYDSAAVYTDSCDATVNGAFRAVLGILEKQQTNLAKQSAVVTDAVESAPKGNLTNIQANIRKARRA